LEEKRIGEGSRVLFGCQEDKGIKKRKKKLCIYLSTMLPFKPIKIT